MRPARPVHSRSLRLRVDIPADLVIGSGKARPVHIIDLSERGAFAETEIQSSPGTQVALHFDVPGFSFKLVGVVAREGTALREAPHPDIDLLVVRMRGLGLRFVSIPDPDRDQLADFLDQTRRGGG